MRDDRTPSTPDQILARQVRIAPTLIYLDGHRSQGPRVIPDQPLPISDDEVKAWISAHPFLRSGLKPEIARALCYLDLFKKEGA